MSFAPLLLTVALQGVSVAPNPPDCAVYAGWLQDHIVRTSAIENEPRLFVSAPFGVRSLSDTSQNSILERHTPLPPETYYSELPPEKFAEYSHRIIKASHVERTRLYDNGVRGNELLDQTDDFILANFPLPDALIQADMTTLQSAALWQEMRPVECRFEGDVPGNTVVAHMPYPEHRWVDLSSGAPIPRSEIGVYYAFSNAAISEDGDQALIYVEYYCGSMCGGSGNFYLMERRESEGWRVTGSRIDWIN